MTNHHFITNGPMIKGLAGYLLPVMATEAEYGPQLQKLCKPLITGVGPIQAAMSLTRFLTQTPLQPVHIVVLGSGGSATLEHLEVYQPSHASYRDMDASALGFPKGVTPFTDNKPTIALDDWPYSSLSPKFNLPAATVATGASVVNQHQYNTIDADMVDMETYALAVVAREFNIPITCLRGVSDGRHHLASVEDWSKSLEILDQKLALLFGSMLSQFGAYDHAVSYS